MAEQENPVEGETGLEPFIARNAGAASLKALAVAFQYGGYDGAHHKDWVIDQMCRAITGENYEAFIAYATEGEDGPGTNPWDEGIAP